MSAYSYQSSFKQVFTSIFFLKTSLKPSVYVSNFNCIWTVNYLFSKENLFSELKRNCSLLLSEANTSVAFTYTKYSFGFIYSFWITGIQKQLEETELANFCQLQPEQLPSSGIFSLYIKTLAKTDMVENMDFCVDLRTHLHAIPQPQQISRPTMKIVGWATSEMMRRALLTAITILKAPVTHGALCELPCMPSLNPWERHDCHIHFTRTQPETQKMNLPQITYPIHSRSQCVRYVPSQSLTNYSAAES